MKDLFENDFLKSMLSDYNVLNRPSIRATRDLHDLREVYRLVHDCYVDSGYCQPHPSGLIVHYPHFDHIPQTRIFVAFLRGRIVGSVSLTVDGPSGFTLEEDFKEECDLIREEGKAVAVVWRLVVEESSRNTRKIVLGLIDQVVNCLLKENIPTALFSVNPKHENIYKRMLNMEVVARESASHGLKGAPAVLLRGDPTKIPRQDSIPDFLPNPIHALLAASQY